jgi:hypothetical protein
MVLKEEQLIRGDKMYLCTYFDSAYADKGWVCNHTLHQQDPESTLFVLCFDDAVYKSAESKPGVIPIKLKDFEDEFPELLAVKTTRLLKEYYATMSPFLPLYIFKKFKHVDLLFYTDADMAFWNDPKEMIKIMGDKSLMVVDHGFEPPRNNIRFNVGILGYKNNDKCKEFLNWWKQRCLNWCRWVTIPSQGMCADQGYLNILHDKPNKFKDVLSCPHPGVNLAPWNIAKYRISNKNGKIILNDKYNLICYHYHEFKLLSLSSYRSTEWKHTESDRQLVYDPYFKLIRDSMYGLI